jgi:DNA-binding NarL/FixJ family response regulator
MNKNHVTPLSSLTVVYVGERLRAFIAEILARNNIYSVDIQKFDVASLDAASERLGSLDRASDARAVLFIHPTPADDVVRMVSILCDRLPQGESLLLISEDEHHHPVITSIAGAKYLVLSPNASRQQMEQEILRALSQTPDIDTRSSDTAARQQVLDYCRMLTPSELEVLCCILEGSLNKAIASKLDVSERTVENRRRKIFDTFGSHSVAVVTRMVSETIGCDAVFAMRDNLSQ